MRGAVLLLSLAYAFAAAGCREAGGAGWTSTTDTLPGGATLRIHTPPDSGISATWRLEEEVRIGSVGGGAREPATAFGQLKGLAVLADSSVAVLDAQAQEVRVFGPAGEHRATYGGHGSGPGELSAAYGLMRGPEDRLWVPDHRTGRMSIFDPATGFVDSHPFQILTWGFVWRGVMARGAGEGPEPAHILKPSITLEPGRSRLLRVYDLEMNQLDSVFLPDAPAVDPEDPPDAFYWEAPGGLPRGYVDVPHYAEGVTVLDPRGDVWSVPAGDPEYRITRWRPGGDTTLVIETRREPVPVTATERDAAIRRTRETLRDRGGGGERDWSKIPDRKPAIKSMFVADDGRLWVRATTPNAPLTYDVYERDGRYAGTAVGTLDVQEWFDPVVRGDRFWAVVTDDLGIQSVVRARIVPAGEADGD